MTVGGNVVIEDCNSESGYVSDSPQDLKVRGNFTCTGVRRGCIARSGSVVGNLEVNDNGPFEFSEVTGNTIGGNAEVNGNGVFAVVIGNTIGGNAEVDDNAIGSKVFSNTIGGNLTCTGTSEDYIPAGPTRSTGMQRASARTPRCRSRIPPHFRILLANPDPGNGRDSAGNRQTTGDGRGRRLEIPAWLSRHGLTTDCPVAVLSDPTDCLGREGCSKKNSDMGQRDGELRVMLGGTVAASVRWIVRRHEYLT